MQLACVVNTCSLHLLLLLLHTHTILLHRHKKKKNLEDDIDECEVVNDVESDFDLYRETTLNGNIEGESAALLGKRVDSILTGFITGHMAPEQLMFYESVTGKLSMAVNGEVSQTVDSHLHIGVLALSYMFCAFYTVLHSEYG